MVFFGSIADAESYLWRMDRRFVSGNTDPIDYLVEVSSVDSSIQYSRSELPENATPDVSPEEAWDKLDFVRLFTSDILYKNILSGIEARSQGIESSSISIRLPRPSTTKAFWEFLDSLSVRNFNKVTKLVRRNLLTAFRDPTVVLAQFLLEMNFGIGTGLVFFQLSWRIDKDLHDLVGSIAMIANLTTYVMLFRVLFRFNQHVRCVKESSPRTNSITCYWLADVLSTFVELIGIAPAVIIPTVVIGYPVRVLPFLLLTFYVVISKSSHLLLYSIVL